MMNTNYKNIRPIASITTRSEYEEIVLSDAIRTITELENKLIGSTDDAFTVDGYCVPCDREVSFLVDMNYGGQYEGGRWIPNWRERLECPICKMNNRQRLMSALIKQQLETCEKKNVYFMEQVTPIYNWTFSIFNDHNIVGSEYLGYEYKSGDVIDGIRHEDIENLSFHNSELDLVVSNDVFEHVPNPKIAFSECARVLKADGLMIATIPFFTSEDDSVSRARLINGDLEHVLPPVFHGNPISDEGSLVFTDYGWDLLNIIKKAGFSDVRADVYCSVEFCHLGGGQIVFRCIK